jgi:hypothetical protein
MLLCDIASLSRLSITIVSLTGFPRLKNQLKKFRKKPRLQVALYHSKENIKGKERPVQNGCDVAVSLFSFRPLFVFLAGKLGGPFTR